MKLGFSDKKCGILGEHLSHSFSPFIHSYLCDYSYDIYEVAPDDLESFMKNNDLDAWNVTIPYKKAVIPFLDYISPEAKVIGAVNLIIKKNGKLYGYNTDYFGFEYMLESSGVDIKGKKVVLFGTGGASVALRAVLEDKKAGSIVSIGIEDNTKEYVSLHSDASVIVNATPVGMYPNNRKAVTDISLFDSLEAVLDIVYNPMHTEIMLNAEEKGITAIGGLSMLVAQAVKGAEIFTGEKFDKDTTEKIISKIALSTQNIILIGMPSSGKSSVGDILASKLERPFFDADEEFEKMHGITPATAITSLGEDKFRLMEQEVIASLGKMSEAVIATGGGAVTRKENYPSLHQNGIIIFIERDIDKLSTEGRPLSKAGALQELYERRKDAYFGFADIVTDNNDSLEITVDKIISELNSYSK